MYEEDTPPRVSSDAERERAILDVLRERRDKEAALEFQRLRYERERQKQGPGIRHVVFLLALVGTVWVFTGGGLWLQPPPPPPPSAQHLDASLRLALYLQGQQIESFREREGRLPEDLDEIGASFPEIRYSPTNRGTYHLTAVTESRTVFYSSTLAGTVDQFLGSAEERIFPASFWDEGP
ncbi:MAG: hypothetical protein R3223_02175 [Longimicrobiales bacterium]|nr:hypothetical protein [Longimicrobiales bacterium]